MKGSAGVCALLAVLAWQVGAAGQGPPPPPPGANAPAPKGTGLILGRVVDAATNQPIAAAMVSIALLGGGRGGGPAAAGPTSPADARLVTGADGRFVFRELARGSFPITVLVPGYVQGSAGQARPGGPGAPVQLGDGERRLDVVIRMWKYAVITGAIVDEAGEPAVNLTVRAFSRTMAGGRARYVPTGSARTDDRGVYRIASLAPGDYIVGVPQTQVTTAAASIDAMMQGIASGTGAGGLMMDMMSSGGPPPTGANAGVRMGEYLLSSEGGASPVPAPDGHIFVYQTMFFPNATSPTQSTTLPLKSAEERSGIDFQLRLIPTVRVTGTVIGPSGPLGNVGVRLAAVVAESSGLDSAVDVANTGTKADGSFAFLGVPDGQFLIRVLKPPRPELPAELASNPLMQMVLGGGGPATGDAAKLLYADVPVTVGGQDVTGLSITAREGMRVSGRVEFEGAAAKPGAAQLQAIPVGLAPADGRQASMGGGGRPERVAADGRFRTPPYPAGKYFLTFAGNMPGWLVKSIEVGGRDALREPLELKDADLADAVITLFDRPADVNGSVRSDTGPAAQGTMVVLFPQDYRTWIANGMPARVTRSVRTTNAAGAFAMQALLPGEYLIAACDDGAGDAQDPAFIEALARSATAVSISEGEHKALNLRVVQVKK